MVRILLVLAILSAAGTAAGKGQQQHHRVLTRPAVIDGYPLAAGDVYVSVDGRLRHGVLHRAHRIGDVELPAGTRLRVSEWGQISAFLVADARIAGARFSAAAPVILGRRSRRHLFWQIEGVLAGDQVVAGVPLRAAPILLRCPVRRVTRIGRDTLFGLNLPGTHSLVELTGSCRLGRDLFVAVGTLSRPQRIGGRHLAAGAWFARSTATERPTIATEYR